MVDMYFKGSPWLNARYRIWTHRKLTEMKIELGAKTLKQQQPPCGPMLELLPESMLDGLT